MVQIHSTVLIVAVTGVIGAVVLSAVVATHYAVLPEPSSLSGEGQSIFAFLLSVPVGFLLGGTVGFVKQYRSTHGDRWGYLLLIVVGTINTLLIILLGILSSTSRETNLREFWATIISPWCLYPLIASLCVLLRGLFVKSKDGEKVSGTISRMNQKGHD